MYVRVPNKRGHLHVRPAGEREGLGGETSRIGECHLDTLVNTALLSRKSARLAAQMSVYAAPNIR